MAVELGVDEALVAGGAAGDLNGLSAFLWPRPERLNAESKSALGASVEGIDEGDWLEDFGGIEAEVEVAGIEVDVEVLREWDRPTSLSPFAAPREDDDAPPRLSVALGR